MATAQGVLRGRSQKEGIIWVTEEQKALVLSMRGEKIAKIARTVGLSRPAIYRLLDQE